jgi:hypothetical protein
MGSSKSDEQFNEQEARRRFEAALRGARVAGSQHIKSDAPKRSKPPKKRRLKK